MAGVALTALWRRSLRVLIGLSDRPLSSIDFIFCFWTSRKRGQSSREGPLRPDRRPPEPLVFVAFQGPATEGPRHRGASFWRLSSWIQCGSASTLHRRSGGSGKQHLALHWVRIVVFISSESAEVSLFRSVLMALQRASSMLTLTALLHMRHEIHLREKNISSILVLAQASPPPQRQTAPREARHPQLRGSVSAKRDSPRRLRLLPRPTAADPLLCGSSKQRRESHRGNRRRLQLHSSVQLCQLRGTPQVFVRFR